MRLASVTQVAAELASAFHDRFGAPGPSLLVRAPGRVNLIGEHVDYNGLSVLPMAVNRTITVLARPRDDTNVRIASMATGLGLREFALARDIPPYPVGDWGNYAKAATQALERELGPLIGFDAILASTIPVAAGLSSSSALVIAVALALLAANGRSADPLVLADHMARAERYTGTQGGGMDQAICLGAREGTASRVDFDPLRITAIPIPPRWRFIVAHSLQQAEKSGSAQATYNRRTVECRLALEGVTSHLNLSLAGYRDLLATRTAAELIAAGDAVLPDPVRRRFRHVISEADRVAHAEAALRGADLTTLGMLFAASHASLRDDYEVSAPALDELVGIAMEAGAAGARLTGAGMGGCIVAACSVEAAPSVLAGLRERFYGPRQADGDGLDAHLFVAEPAGGATIASVR